MICSVSAMFRLAIGVPTTMSSCAVYRPRSEAKAAISAMNRVARSLLGERTDLRCEVGGELDRDVGAGVVEYPWARSVGRHLEHGQAVELRPPVAEQIVEAITVQLFALPHR